MDTAPKAPAAKSKVDGATAAKRKAKTELELLVDSVKRKAKRT